MHLIGAQCTSAGLFAIIEAVGSHLRAFLANYCYGIHAGAISKALASFKSITFLDLSSAFMRDEAFKSLSSLVRRVLDKQRLTHRVFRRS